MRGTRLFLFGLIAFGLLLPARLMAAKEAQGEKFTETPVKLDDLPKAVKRTVQEKSGNHPLAQLMKGDRPGGKVAYFRAVIDTAGDEKLEISVAPDGKLLSERQLNARAAAAAARPHEAALVPAGAQAVDYDSLPGGVKTTVGHEAGTMKVVRTYKYTENNDTMYLAIASDGVREEGIRVHGNGKLAGEQSVTEAGGLVISYDKVPYAPKVTIGKEAGAGKIVAIHQITVNEGGTYYNAYVDDGKGTVRKLQVAEDGKLHKTETMSTDDFHKNVLKDR